MRYRGTWLLPLITAVALAALWTHAVLRVQDERVAAVESGWRLAENWAQRLAERTERLMHQADLSSRLVGQMQARHGVVDLSTSMRRQILPGEFGAQVSLLTPEGRIVASSSPALLGLSYPRPSWPDLGERTRMIVGDPVDHLPAGSLTLPLAQRFDHADGRMAGMVLITVDPAVLTRDLIHDDLGTGAMLMTLGVDGTVRARDVDEIFTQGGRIDLPAWRAAIGAAHQARRAPLDPIDAEARFVALRDVMGFDMTVAVGVPEHEAMAAYVSWRNGFLVWVALDTVLMAAAATAVSLQMRRLRRLRRQAERARQEFRGATDASLDAFHLLRAVRDARGQLVDLACIDTNERGAQLLGLPRRALVGRTLMQLLPEAGTRRFIEHCDAVMKSGRVREREYRPGSLRLRAEWIHQQVVPLEDGVALTTRDVSARRRLEQEKERDHAFLRTMLDQLPVGVWAQRCMDGAPARLLFVNRAARRLFALPAHADFAGMTAREAMGPVVGEWLDAQSARVQTSGRRHTTTEHPVDTAEGRRWLTVTTAPVGDTGTEADWLLGMAVDVSEQRGARNTLQHMALYDALTGLPNRAHFHARLQEAVSEGRDRPFTLLFLDIDHFKSVNDSIGHAAGDTLLVSVAARLRALVREGDTVGRLGGDEFTIVARDITDREAAAALCQRVAEAMSAPFEVGGRRLHAGTSIGVCLFPEDGTDAERLLRRADLAMYRVKESGRNGFRFFEPSMEVEADAQLRVEQDLRDAIDSGELYLVYQPKYDLRTDRICGWEALARWQHPEHGSVPPGTFIPIAEKSDLIVELGEWAIGTACGQLRRWLDDGLEPGPVSVNVSARQFHRSDLPGVIRDALVRHRLPARMLELELTESAMLADEEQAARVLEELRLLGVTVAIDDFGTGYSALSTLSRLPVKTLKIDRSFLLSSARDATGVALLEGTVALVRGLGLHTVVEGVETLDQLALVKRCGVDEAQGWGLARPMGADRVPGWLQSQSVIEPAAVGLD